MGINIQAKTDVSYLFSSLGSGAAGVAGSNFLADYASIKNGSYLKLMKAYYGSNSNSTVNSIVKNSTANKTSGTNALSTEESKAYTQVKSAADSLKESADALQEQGQKSLFTMKDITTKDENGFETTTKGYDTESIYKAVNSFVTNYNSVITASDNVDSTTVARRTATMMNTTTSNLKSLLSIGISVNSNGTLSLDKDTFMDSNMSTVKSLFNGTGSYGYQVSAQASLINSAADSELRSNGIYTMNGTYSTNYSSGYLFNSGF